MLGPVIATDNEVPKLERVKEKDPNKGNQTETGTCVETEKEKPGVQGKTREYEKPSLIHGTENTIIGTLKVIFFRRVNDIFYAYLYIL